MNASNRFFINWPLPYFTQYLGSFLFTQAVKEIVIELYISSIRE